ncbi:MAG: LysR family transcriptional regulator [Methylobacteriaceae bacterium]|nr:LysR family transcriptional regulator [Methylobacteriaceae bacterium]
MDLDWFEDYAALVETENFTKAAERRHVTQSAFSRRIRMLEEWVGGPLFVRGTRRVELTDLGRAVRSDVELITRTVPRLRLAVRQNATLHFAATHSLSFSFFPGWIKRYTGVFGRTPINLISDSMAVCTEALVQGRVQLLLSYDSPTALPTFRNKSFAYKTVGTDTLSPYSATGKDGKPIWSLDSPLAGPPPWVRHAPGTAFMGMMEEHPRIVEFMASSVPGFTASLAVVALRVVEEGQGIAWLPGDLVARAVARGDAVRAGGEHWDIPISIRLFISRDEQNPTALALWREVRDEYVPGPGEPEWR